MTPEQAIAELKTSPWYGRAMCFSGAVKTLEELIPKPDGPDIVRVRIAVAVSGPEWPYSCCVSKAMTDEEAMTQVEIECDGTPIARAFIEADVPRLATVQGRVVT